MAKDTVKIRFKGRRFVRFGKVFIGPGEVELPKDQADALLKTYPTLFEPLSTKPETKKTVTEEPVATKEEIEETKEAEDKKKEEEIIVVGEEKEVD